MKQPTWTVEGGENEPEIRSQGLIELSTISHGYTHVAFEILLSLTFY